MEMDRGHDGLLGVVGHPQTIYDNNSLLPRGKLSNVQIADEEYLHRNIFINSSR